MTTVERAMWCTICDGTIFFAVGGVCIVQGTISFAVLPDGRSQVTSDALGPTIVVHECAESFGVVAQAEAFLTSPGT